MIYRANIRPAWVVLFLLLLFAVAFALVKGTDSSSSGKKVKPVAKNKIVNLEQFPVNEKCLRCHGQSKYTFENAESKKISYKRMYSELIIDRNEFYISNHKGFKCTDCHSEDYLTFPHPGNLRMEAKANCIDCHGGDEKYAKFQFEKIDSNFMTSVHSQKHSEEFTCWMCHNPHTYRINARTNENLQETVAYDNLICLNCHGDVTKYELLTNKQQPNILQKHDWLPNQATHFINVRCIECHARNKDTLLIAHEIMPKNMAVKKCESCHAKNSILYASLFKYQVKENIKKQGLFKGLFLSETSTIGPDQNNTLNIISIVLFSLTILAILIHAVIRIQKSH
ncbi:MAG: cytochrome c3 family protein [Bacteroidota bacterium]|jgi:Cytochrome c3/Cytochrome c554 and c-prime